MTSKYIPPPISGYVHYSNYRAKSYDDGHLYTKESIIAFVCRVFPNVTADEVTVVDFMPDGPIEGPYADYRTRWASFIHERHALLVAQKYAALDALRELSASMLKEMR